MDVKLPAYADKGVIYLNTKHFGRIAGRNNLLQLGRMLMHEVGHTAGIDNTQAGEAQAGIFARLAMGQSMDAADIKNEIDKAAQTDKRLVTGATAGAVESILQSNELGIQAQQGQTWAGQLRETIANFRPGAAVPESLNLLPGFFKFTSQLSSTLRSGLLNVLWTGLASLPLGGVVWSAVLGFVGPSLRAALVEQAVLRVRGIGSAEEAGQVLDFVSALAAIPGMESTALDLELPEGRRTINIPNEIMFRPALLHRLLAPVLNENNILQLQQEHQRNFNAAA
jgi:hypothetical protein